MREFIKDKKDRNFYEACMLFGEEDCKKIKELITEGKDKTAKKIIDTWNLPLCARCECIRLILNCSNEKAREWYKLNDVNF